MSELFSRIYDLVRQVPSGRVTSYGEVGRLAGCSGRVVGFAMAALKPGSDVPWQRVINVKGEVSSRRDADRDLFQRDLLENEGIEFDVRGRVDLARYGHDFYSSKSYSSGR